MEGNIAVRLGCLLQRLALGLCRQEAGSQSANAQEACSCTEQGLHRDVYEGAKDPLASNAAQAPSGCQQPQRSGAQRGGEGLCGQAVQSIPCTEEESGGKRRGEGGGEHKGKERL